MDFTMEPVDTAAYRIAARDEKSSITGISASGLLIRNPEDILSSYFSTDIEKNPDNWTHPDFAEKIKAQPENWTRPNATRLSKKWWRSYVRARVI